ncbi:RNA polymerase sigma factor [Streptomyces sp. NPDC050743]|uniref:RNA polymerase sigma factor n=1 Tax=Streptomyces sp. NPDC050743 TaxID=3365634 RepID=UPI0037A88D40
MNMGAEIVDTVDAVLGGEHAARIERDAARIEELAHSRFEGPAYEVFELELCREAQPILLGMLRTGTLPRLALEKCRRQGWKFFVHEDDMRLLRSNSTERDTIMVDVLTEATRKFHRDLQSGKGWKADHKGPRGACCVMTYFIGQCVWVFRRAYVRWATQRVKWARLHAVYDFTEDAANVAGIGGLLQATSYEIESEALSTDFEDILDEQAPATQAVVRLTVMGFPDAEIAERLNLTHANVRQRRSRFRTALYQAAREHRIWIPEQLHTKAVSRPQKRGAA